jgi:hypothetical protein
MSSAAEPCAGTAPYRYRAHGLRFASDMPLVDLPPDPEPGASDDEVAIRIAPLPALPEDARQSIGIRFEPSPDRFSFEWPGVVRYRIDGSHTIVADHDASRERHQLEPFLAGTAIAAICYRRGMLPLHASCVMRDGGAIAVAAASGTGKSTLAAQLEARGATVLADDLAVLRVGADVAPPEVASGLVRMKLCSDAALRLGHDVTGLRREAEASDKYYVPVRTAPPDRMFPLRALYLLTDSEGEAPPPRRLEGIEAFDALLEQAFRPELPKLLDIGEAHLMRCARLLREVPLFLFARRRGAQWIEAETDRIERHIAALPRR